MRPWSRARAGRARAILRGLALASLLAAGVAVGARATPPRQAAATAPQASRIISLVPAVTEMLFAMGAGPQVVGVSSFDHYPPEAETRPKVGALVDPDFERILALRPDLVVVYGSQDDLIGRLGEAGISVYSYRHAGLANITPTIRDLGARVGHADAARAVAERIDGDLARVRAAVAGRPRPSTALVFGREAGTLRGIYASGGIGFLHDLLVTAGGRNAFGDVAREGLQASVELLLARAPDVIIELQPTQGWQPERLEEALRVWARLPSIPAVRSGRVHVLVGDKLLIAGPRVAESAQAFARVLHPGAL